MAIAQSAFAFGVHDKFQNAVQNPKSILDAGRIGLPLGGIQLGRPMGQVVPTSMPALPKPSRAMGHGWSLRCYVLSVHCHALVACKAGREAAWRPLGHFHRQRRAQFPRQAYVQTGQVALHRQVDSRVSVLFCLAKDGAPGQRGATGPVVSIRLLFDLDCQLHLDPFLRCQLPGCHHWLIWAPVPDRHRQKKADVAQHPQGAEPRRLTRQRACPRACPSSSHPPSSPRFARALLR